MRPTLKVGTVLIFFLAVVGLLGFLAGKPSLTLTTNLGLAFDRPSDPTQPWIEQVSWSPRVFVYHNILKPEECQEIIGIGQKDLSESKVVAASGGCTLKSLTHLLTLVQPNPVPHARAVAFSLELIT